MEVNRNADEIARLRAELETTRNQMFHMARLAEMGKLVAVVVHELSQPLLGIKAFAQILRRKYETDEFIEPKAKMIEQQSLHMEGLLDTLRQYSILGRSETNVIDPLVPVRAAMDLFRERAKKLRVRVALEEKPNLSKVRSSRGHLQQVMTNLIKNAFDELEQTGGGDVVVRVDRIEGSVRIRVADSGRGVPAEVRAHLFESFFTTKDDKGTGLGLSICREILRLHGGEIRLMPLEEAQTSFDQSFATVFEVILLAAEEA